MLVYPPLISRNSVLNISRCKMIITSSNINSPYLIDAKKVVAQNFRNFNHQDAYEFARRLKFDLTRIPQEIIDIVSESSSASYYYAEKHDFDLSKIPPKIIEAIGKDARFSWWFIDMLLQSNLDPSKIPHALIQGTSMQSYTALGFARRLNFDLTKIPPEIIESISKNPEYSYEFASALGFDPDKIPQKIIDGMLLGVK